ncbi:TPA: hypothetical protein ACF35N_004485 [Vibrio parahaemolyticus]
MATLKIRKNAKNKISNLINSATYITEESHSMGLDDCFSSNGEHEINAQNAFDFIEENYHKLIVELITDNEGNNKRLVLANGPYHFSKQIFVYFTAKPLPAIDVKDVTEAPQKPRMTLKQVQAYREQGFISPLSHSAKEEQPEEDQDKKIVGIKVLWSESSVFNNVLRTNDSFDINQEISIDQYNRLAALTILSQRKWAQANGEQVFGYDKTKVELKLGNGQTVTFRHDICPKEPTLQGEWAAWVDYCRAEDAKKELAQARKQQNNVVHLH